jgi:hypothetical protein
MSGISDEAFRPGTSFATACSAGTTEVAIIEFLGTDGVTPIYTTNDFGCGAYTNGPGVSAGIDPKTGVGVSGNLVGYKVSGWHLLSDLSDTALTFPWVPFTGPVAVNDLLVYGDWTALEDVVVSLPSGTARVGDTVTVTVLAEYLDGTKADVSSLISSLTSKDIATGRADTVNGNQVTFVGASTHEICATFQGETGCATIKINPRLTSPGTGFLTMTAGGAAASLVAAFTVAVTGAVVGRKVLRR